MAEQERVNGGADDIRQATAELNQAVSGLTSVVSEMTQVVADQKRDDYLFRTRVVIRLGWMVLTGWITALATVYVAIQLSRYLGEIGFPMPW